MQNLALKFRPETMDDICGQKQIVDVFKKFIANNNLPNSIFFGPAGSGKTTMARIICKEAGIDLYELDATGLKVDELRKIISRYQGALYKPLIFIDEIHRLSKVQQEVLLLPMENKDATIIGATTENPKFVLSSGIRSRMLLFEFFPLTSSDLNQLLNRVCLKIKFKISDDAKEYLLRSSCGDARSMLNLLEFALLVSQDIDISLLKTLRANSVSEGTSSDDTHYNLTSAFIKSLRGSDENAALYYMARLINAGESPDFLARRMVIFSSEDIGNANPNALNLATSTLTAVSKIGFPEARIILSQCAIYLACSPKSNSSYKAINEALDFVSSGKKIEIPKYLINTDIKRKDYIYPHDFIDSDGSMKSPAKEQIYAPDVPKFYNSKKVGFEKTLFSWSEKIKNKDEEKI